MRKPRHWYCEVYSTNVYYHLGWTYKAFCAYYKIEAQDRAPLGSTHVLENCDLAIFVADAERLDVLVHESVHAANALLSFLGVHARYDNDEAQAYLVDAIFRKGWKR